MSDKNYYEQTDAQFKIRLPHGLKEKIRQSSEQYNRTMTADIVARLEQTFDMPSDVVALDDYQRLLAENQEIKNMLVNMTRSIARIESTFQKEIEYLNKKPTA